MNKEKIQKEEEKKQVKKRLVCEECDSKFVYALVDSTIVCRRCSHRSSPPKE